MSIKYKKIIAIFSAGLVSFGAAGFAGEALAAGQKLSTGTSFMPLSVASHGGLPLTVGAAKKAPAKFMSLNSKRGNILAKAIPLHGEDKTQFARLRDLQTVSRVAQQDMLIQKEPVKGEQLTAAAKRAIDPLLSSPLPVASTIPEASFVPANLQKADEDEGAVRETEIASADIPVLEAVPSDEADLRETGANLDKDALTATITDNLRRRRGTKTGYIWPVAGKDQWISSGYGTRIHPVTRKKAFHGGIDIAAKTGTPVLAVAEGRISDVGTAPNLGRYVRIEHIDGTSSLYGHLHQAMARKGAQVMAGQLIGKVGATGRTTGPHLHLSLYNKGGDSENPMAMLPHGHAHSEKTLAMAK